MSTVAVFYYIKVHRESIVGGFWAMVLSIQLFTLTKYQFTGVLLIAIKHIQTLHSYQSHTFRIGACTHIAVL